MRQALSLGRQVTEPADIRTIGAGSTRERPGDLVGLVLFALPALILSVWSLFR